LIETMLDQNKISPVSDYLGNIKTHYKRLSAFQRELRATIQSDPDFEKVLSSVTGNGV